MHKDPGLVSNRQGPLREVPCLHAATFGPEPYQGQQDACWNPSSSRILTNESPVTTTSLYMSDWFTVSAAHDPHLPRKLLSFFGEPFS
jgi:hypothetical protein